MIGERIGDAHVLLGGTGPSLMCVGIQDSASFVLPRPRRVSLSVGERSRGFPPFSHNSLYSWFRENCEAAAPYTVRLGLVLSCLVLALDSYKESLTIESMNIMNCFTSKLVRIVALSALALGSLAFVAEAQGPTGSSQTNYSHTESGFKGGTATITDVRTCINCSCGYSGSPTVSETFMFYGCSATVASTTLVDCPPTAACPDGVKGSGTLYKVECCDVFLELGFFCFSYQVSFPACG